MGETYNQAWITPEILSDPSYCMRIVVPPELARTVRGAILLATVPEAWEPVGAVSPDDAASAMLAAFNSMIFTEPACMIGTVLPFISESTPSGLLLCDGTYYAKDDYLALYNALPGSMKDEDGFTVPDLRERFLFGSSANYVEGSIGGAAVVTLGLDEIPPHTHSEIGASSVVINGGLEAPANSAVPIASTTGSAGDGQAHNNMPPYYAIKWGIRWV